MLERSLCPKSLVARKKTKKFLAIKASLNILPRTSVSLFGEVGFATFQPVDADV